MDFADESNDVDEESESLPWDEDESTGEEANEESSNEVRTESEGAAAPSQTSAQEGFPSYPRGPPSGRYATVS